MKFSFSTPELIDFLDTEVVEVLNGVNQKCDLSFDSRQINSRTLFWPLKGSNYDAHCFLKDVCQLGAMGIVYSQALSSEVISIIEQYKILAIKVKDTNVALHRLAKSWREKVNPKVIAITGSNGKTTTKDLVHQLLKKHFKVVSSKGSLNNEFGLCFTMLSLEEGTDVGVFELGMNHHGELSFLTKLLNPDIAVVLNVGDAHIGHFKSVDDIAKAKSEIVQELAGGKTVIINNDLKQYSYFWERTDLNYISVANKDNQEIYYTVSNCDQSGLSLTYSQGDESSSFTTALVGQHNAINIALSISLSFFMGLNSEDIQQGLSNFYGSSMRNQKLSSAARQVTVINDAYNASPQSYYSLIETLSFYRDQPKHFVFGEMLELGDKSEDYHREVATRIDKVDCKQIYGYGQQTKNTKDEFRNNIYKYYDNKDYLIEDINQKLEAGDMLVLKGSRSLKLESILEPLFEDLS